MKKSNFEESGSAIEDDKLNLDKYHIGKLGGMFASVSRTVGVIDPGDPGKGLRVVLTGEIIDAEV